MPLVKSEAIHPRCGYSAPAGAYHRMNPADWATATALYERYLEDVFRYVLRRVPRQEEAEDITVQVFTAAFEGLPRFRGQCSPYLWLLGIARRQIAAALRQRAARRETLASELADEGSDADPFWEALVLEEGPEAVLMRAEAWRVLHDLVDQLTADQRESLLLRYLEEMSVAEIAVVMGRSRASVKSLLQRARATLHHLGRGYFVEDHEGDEQ